jgi:hypothetical protein
MNLSKRILLPGILGLLLVFSFSASAQWDKKPYTEWNAREAEKVIKDSPWGKTQVFTSPGVSYNTGISGGGGIAATRGGKPPDRPTDALHVNFRIYFLSAKPVRQAFSRLMELKQKKGPSEELAEQLKAFASGEFLEYIIIAVDCDSDQAGENVQEGKSLLQRSGTATLKNNTFIETKGGSRVFLQEFQQPRRDGLGARFVFPRLKDGKPFITGDSDEIHFYAQLSDTYKLDRRYKIKDMMYEGKLEY